MSAQRASASLFRGIYGRRVGVGYRLFLVFRYVSSPRTKEKKRRIGELREERREDKLIYLAGV